MRETKEKIRNNQITYLSDEKLIQKVIFQLDKNINKGKKNWKQLLFDVIREWKLSNEKFSTNQINYLISQSYLLDLSKSLINFLDLVLNMHQLLKQ